MDANPNYEQKVVSHRVECYKDNDYRHRGVHIMSQCGDRQQLSSRYRSQYACIICLLYNQISYYYHNLYLSITIIVRHMSNVIVQHTIVTLIQDQHVALFRPHYYIVCYFAASIISVIKTKISCSYHYQYLCNNTRFYAKTAASKHKKQQCTNY